MKNLILLTSCIVPVIGSVENTNPLLNLYAAYRTALTFRLSSRFCSASWKILLVDCSSPESLKCYLRFFDDFSDVFSFYNVIFTQKELKQCNLLGKGYSEMLMIRKTFDYLTSTGNSYSICLKVSARYCPIFTNQILSRVDSNKFFVSYSHLFATTTSHSFIAPFSSLSLLSSYCLQRVSDASQYTFLEKIIYQFLFESRLIPKTAVRRLPYMLYLPDISAGSIHARSNHSSFYFQFLRLIASLAF